MFAATRTGRYVVGSDATAQSHDNHAPLNIKLSHETAVNPVL